MTDAGRFAKGSEEREEFRRTGRGDWDWYTVADDMAGAIDARDALIAQLREALEVALNYWEPRCSGGDCDKGYHNDEFHAHKTARAVLAAAAQARGRRGK